MEDFNENERRIYDKVKEMVADAYKRGHMDGVKSALGVEAEDAKVRRFEITPLGLIALLIIILGSIFSFGMYIGGLNV